MVQLLCFSQPDRPIFSDRLHQPIDYAARVARAADRFGSDSTLPHSTTDCDSPADEHHATQLHADHRADGHSSAHEHGDRCAADGDS